MFSDKEQIEVVEDLRLGDVLGNLPELLSFRRATGDLGPTYVIVTCICGERFRCTCSVGRFVAIWVENGGRHVITTSPSLPLEPDQRAFLEESGFVHDGLPDGCWRQCIEGRGGVLEAARTLADVLHVAYGASDGELCDLEHWHDAGDA